MCYGVSKLLNLCFFGAENSFLYFFKPMAKVPSDVIVNAQYAYYITSTDCKAGFTPACMRVTRALHFRGHARTPR